MKQYVAIFHHGHIFSTKQFHKESICCKIRRLHVFFDKLQTSSAYNNTGTHFDFSSCMTTASEAILPIFFSKNAISRTIKKNV